MSKNAEGWIRHRGGKAPVSDDVFIDVRYRDGEILECQKFEKSDAYLWAHSGGCGDIMAYRLHKQAWQAVNMEALSATADTFGDSHADVMESVLSRIEGPLQWRDRITEIDATTHSLTTERAELVQKLASEGFALIGRINDLLTEAAQKHEDMGDPKSWMEGDLIESVSDDRVDISIGVKYQLVDDCNGRLVRFRDDDGDIRDRPADLYKFHSRPSA